MKKPVKSKFIIVEHNAKKARLHWDLRFRKPNSKIWMSFAVRKGVPKDPGKKTLAVRTHDHTEKEALFLGKIEKGYGAGTLKKWDDGDCEIIKNGPGHFVINFKGRKVKGIYHLINTGLINKKEYKQQKYLLFKGKIVNERMGMRSLVPRAGIKDDVEEGESEFTGKKLPWSGSK